MSAYANGPRKLYPSQPANPKAQFNNQYSQQLIDSLLPKKNEIKASSVQPQHQQQFPATKFTYYQEAQPQNINKVQTSGLTQKNVQGQQQKGFQIRPHSPKLDNDKLIQKLQQQNPAKVYLKNESTQLANQIMNGSQKTEKPYPSQNLVIGGKTTVPPGYNELSEKNNILNQFQGREQQVLEQQNRFDNLSSSKQQDRQNSQLYFNNKGVNQINNTQNNNENIYNLYQQNIELRQELQKLQLQISQCKCQTNQSYLVSYEKQFKESQNREQLYKNEIQRLQNELEQKNEELKSKNQEITALFQKSQIQKLQNNYFDELQNSKQEIQKLNSQLQQTNESKMKEIQKYQTDGQKLQEQLKNYENQILKLQQQDFNQKDQFNKLKEYQDHQFQKLQKDSEEKIQNLQKENEKLTKQAQLWEQEKLQYNKMKDQFTLDLKQKEQKTNSEQQLQRQMKNYESQILDLQKENEKLSNQAKQWEQEKQQYLKQIQQFDGQKQQVQSLQKQEFKQQTTNVQQQFQQINQQTMPTKFPDLGLVSIFLGEAGVGKTMIMKKLFDNKVHELFKPIKQQQLNCLFTDTESFDFESDIDKREEQIIKYRKLFKDNCQKINNLFLIVNFERTDIMKRKIMSIYKFMRSFQEIISIIITDFHLSENEQQDQNELRNKFQIFKPQEMIFIGKNTQKQQLLELLWKICTVDSRYKIDLKGTIFEDEDQEEQQKIMQSFNQQFNQKRH